MLPTIPPKTVLETLLEWSEGRLPWQRDAMRRVVATGKLSGSEIKELAELCKKDFGSASELYEARPLEAAHLPSNPGSGSAVSLLAISDVTGANNLAPEQTLAFAAEGMTIVYGHNGAGKSGYARVLKRACRARHAGKISPNVYDDSAPQTASAHLVYAVGGVVQPSIRWQDTAQPQPTLSAISVFDSECATVHIKEKNEVAFRPFGLDVPDELAACFQAVKDILTAEKSGLEAARNPIFLAPTWKPTTKVGEKLAALATLENEEEVLNLAELLKEESIRLARLRNDLAKDPIKVAAEQTVRADTIKGIISEVRKAEAATSDEALELIRAVSNDARLKQEAARLSAERAFGEERLPDIGGSVWRTLWESARRYALTTAYPEEQFPPTSEGNRCVLCLQPLQDAALARMSRFEAFVSEDTALQAEEATGVATKALEALRALRISTKAIKVALDELRLRDQAVWAQVRRSLACARLRRYVFLRLPDSSRTAVLPAAVASPLMQLAGIETDLREYANEIRRSASAEERKKLLSELDELHDRATLAGMIPAVLEELGRYRAIRFLNKCIASTSTNAITRVGNEIADNLITPHMRDQFQAEILRLAAEKVRVEIVRSGGRHGSPQYQIRLVGNADAKVHEVLSEGERSCVALAAFFTELATAAHDSALVFDDPVSSLDHRWRGKVAGRLVDEAQRRQVIVFTHDLVFLNDLIDRAVDGGQKAALVTLSRGRTGAGQVTVGLPWKAQSVEDRLDRLEKAARAAQASYENNEEEAYELEVARIYNNLRATWERALEDIAFSRVLQRHRDYINAKDLKKVSVLTAADCDAFASGFKNCCDIVDAHDPSAGRNATAPTPDQVMLDIQSLKTWASSLRTRQKNSI